jgi:hypothetical protein
MDHIVPRAKGGSSNFKNLGLACSVCNNGKRAHTRASDPDTGRQVRLFNPRKDRWSRHFHWSKDFGTIIGSTAVGRATVAALKMNDPHIVALRLVWAGWKMHPPN